MRQRTSTPMLGLFNNAADLTNAGLAVATWGRMEAYFSGTTSDYIKLVTTNATGANTGTSASTGRNIGINGTATLCDVAELLYVNRELAAAEKTNLDAYVTARYGTGLT